MFYITGDTHGDFSHIEDFCLKKQTTKKDVLIILGDVGLNFYGEMRDSQRKAYVQSLPITFFCIHGNHEMRPSTIKTYETKRWHKGTVYYEEAYPNILFARDGEIYDFDHEKILVIGGAASVDKDFRIANNYAWWPDEQPSDEIKKIVEQCCEFNDWSVDVVLSHTIPWKYRPKEVKNSMFNSKKADHSTEKWLDTIEEKLDYYKWYCGHFHIDKQIDDIEFMFHTIHEF